MFFLGINMPIDETIQICLDTLYRSDDIANPGIEESILKKLLLKCTRGVEFSFNNSMYRQVDGVAMGSPLGPIPANIFLGHCEPRIPEEHWPEFYRRYVDDTFSIFSGSKIVALRFLDCLNSLHPSLEFTMESEADNRLPFLDALVIRDGRELKTTVYRKPTFTSLYIRWDSYCDSSQKIALIRSLTVRAKRICSPEYLDDEISKLESIFEGNGYPPPIVKRVIAESLNRGPPVLTAELKPVYLRLPWLGTASVTFRNRIQRVTKNAVPWCKPILCFTSRAIFNTCRKDALSAEKISNIIYLFDCVCVATVTSAELPRGLKSGSSSTSHPPL